MLQIKKFIFIIIALTCFPLFSFSVPSEFYVTQNWISLTSTFDISTKETKLGIVDRKFWSLRAEYCFYDNENKLQARARRRWISFGAVFDVYDNQDQIIGLVNERIISIFPTFDITTPSGEVLATAKMNFWGTTYTVWDPITQKEMATLSRPYFRLKDNWTVNITDPELFSSKLIDPRLFITVMAFQTDCDSWKNRTIAARIDAQKSDLASFNTSYQNTFSREFELTDEDFEAVIQLVEAQVGNAQNEERYFEAIYSLLNQDNLSYSQKEALSELLKDAHQRAYEIAMQDGNL